jgi:hypothetical protein
MSAIAAKFTLVDLPEGPSATAVRSNILYKQFAEWMKTAATKERVTDLSMGEASAILFFADIPYEITETGITFHKCGIARVDGKWTAFMGR